jgi:hypothetical protein
MVAQRHELVAALADYALGPFRPEARRFLRGLSADEMQFIAEFLGASIVHAQMCAPRGAGDILLRRVPDRSHKMLVLIEYLRRSGLQGARGPATAGPYKAAS